MGSKKKYCCKDMKYHANYKCSVHKDPFDCPDNLIRYNKKRKEFGIIIHDGGHSYIVIDFCPWCGSALTSKK
jgi:hypothetical protein